MNANRKRKSGSAVVALLLSCVITSPAAMASTISFSGFSPHTTLQLIESSMFHFDRKHQPIYMTSKCKGQARGSRYYKNLAHLVGRQRQNAVDIDAARIVNSCPPSRLSVTVSNHP